jgi:D-3-phosphoglycerate dehydrogenase / 2-oxoglutarate reductase
MPVVLITPEALIEQPGPYVDNLRAAGFEVRYPRDHTFTRGLGTEQQTIDELRGVSAVLAGGEYITAAVLEKLPELRVIARSGVGYDRIDVPAATRHKVALTITPTANHEAVAEHALALVLAVAKSIVSGDRAVRAGRWPKQATRPIRGSTIGIVGLGRIGRSMALRAAAVGMKVIATEKFPDESFVRAQKIELVDLDTLLARSDYVSVHCPSNAETRQMFNARLFAKMKRGGVFINTARGELVAEADLLAALKSGHLAGAGLDVFEQEPPSVDNPLFKLDNVVVCPHIAGADELSQMNMAIEAADCIIRLSRNDWPAGAVVNAELQTDWKW